MFGVAKQGRVFILRIHYTIIIYNIYIYISYICIHNQCIYIYMYNMYVLNACNQQIHVITCICSHINRDTYTQITYLGEGFTVRPKEWTCFFLWRTAMCPTCVWDEGTSSKEQHFRKRRKRITTSCMCVYVYTTWHKYAIHIFNTCTYIYMYIYIHMHCI